MTELPGGHSETHDSGSEGGGPIAVVKIPNTGSGAISRALSNGHVRVETPGKAKRNEEKAVFALEAIASEPGLQAVVAPAPYGLCRQFLPSNTRYLTVLLDPVDRVLGHYAVQAAGDPAAGRERLKERWEFALNAERVVREGHAEGPPIELDEDADLTLEAGLARKITMYENLMTRFLWGGESIFGDLPPEALERAKENLTHFWFVGVGERLEESVVLLARRLGVGPMPYLLEGMEQRAPGLDETAPELIELIAEHNALDAELYRFARERFDDNAPPPGELEREIEELRRRNLQYSAESEAKRLAERTAKVAAKKARVGGRNENRAAKKGARKKPPTPPPINPSPPRPRPTPHVLAADQPSAGVRARSAHGWRDSLERDFD